MKHFNTAIPRFSGYRDAIGRFVPFSLAEDVFMRARQLGARVLLRLELNADEQLCGMLYTNAASLAGDKHRSMATELAGKETAPGTSPGAS
ncbi:MAG: hypothetical protein IT494_00915 [Gammaproteobacteria bacterium]|nr:hypothetical protein [Gammaproteobacteria bacterium]